MKQLGITLILAAYCGFSMQQLVGQKRLNDYISHYEGLTYDKDITHNQHLRARRSVNDPYVHLKFDAHGRSFHLRLRRDTSVFHKDIKIERTDGALEDHDISYIYEGELWGEPNTQVYGSVIRGVFAGTIRTPRETYHVEKAEHYFRNTDPGFHSVIYTDHDIDTEATRKKRSAADLGGCGSADSNVNEWMKSVQNSAVETPSKKKRSAETSKFVDRPIHENIYTAEYNRAKRASEHQQQQKKRATADNKRTCTLFLQSDTMLWEHMTGDGENDLGYDEEQAREEISSLFALHVKGVKNIYQDTMFESSGMKYSGFSFVVRRVKINETSKDCSGNIGANNKFCERNIDVSNFLNLNSLRNHNDFCLAYVFTFRDFTGGTLGLAWVGSPTRASGGICEQWKQYNEKDKRLYKSLNTGIVTLINYGARVPPKVSTLTFAHELGHNFGSPHDSGTECAPKTNREGNYIMFASATSGDLPNNNQFSPCSLANITLVLNTVLLQDQDKTNCFVESEEAFCGNEIVEDNEQCDCGYVDDCEDQCCNPRGSGETIQCTLKTDAQCSPTAGPCCTSQCEKVPADDNKVCRKADSCTKTSICNGMTAECPSPVPEANLTTCNDFTQVCVSGECQWSICRKIGWEQCSLVTPKETDKDFDKGTLCYVACENPDTNKCVSSGDEAALGDASNTAFSDFLKENSRLSEGIKLPPGAPCDNYQGYCDVFQKCRGVDADGPLARLKNLLFSEETFNNIKNWIIRYWWAVLLIGIGVIILMGLFIAACAVHTPSSNPKRAPARKISLKPHPRQRQQGPPPPGYSAGPNRGGPPHGKGRGPSQQPPAYNPAFQYEMKNQGASGHQQRV